MNVKLTATLVCSALFLSACANNMSTNDMLSLGTSGVQALTLSDSQLRDTANQSCAQMDKANNVAAANSKYTQRLNNIKKGLPTNIDGVPLNFKVYQVRDINAWAMPNGCIRVYSGLMDMMTDDEVRGVLGHEIGHVQLGHSKNRFRVAALASLGREVLAKSGNSTVANLNAGELGDLSEKFLNAQFSQKHWPPVLKNCPSFQAAKVQCLTATQAQTNAPNASTSAWPKKAKNKPQADFYLCVYKRPVNLLQAACVLKTIGKTP